jgi:hypothetical protein
MKSIPLDMLVFDELDEASPDAKTLVQLTRSRRGSPKRYGQKWSGFEPFRCVHAAGFAPVGRSMPHGDQAANRRKAAHC